MPYRGHKLRLIAQGSVGGPLDHPHTDQHARKQKRGLDMLHVVFVCLLPLNLRMQVTWSCQHASTSLDWQRICHVQLGCGPRGHWCFELASFKVSRLSCVVTGSPLKMMPMTPAGLRRRVHAFFGSTDNAVPSTSLPSSSPKLWPRQRT
eukprot:2266478-Amphidinium_carterae.1